MRSTLDCVTLEREFKLSTARVEQRRLSATRDAERKSEQRMPNVKNQGVANVRELGPMSRHRRNNSTTVFDILILLL